MSIKLTYDIFVLLAFAGFWTRIKNMKKNSYKVILFYTIVVRNWEILRNWSNYYLQLFWNYVLTLTITQ